MWSRSILTVGIFVKHTLYILIYVLVEVNYIHDCGCRQYRHSPLILELFSCSCLSEILAMDFLLLWTEAETFRDFPFATHTYLRICCIGLFTLILRYTCACAVWVFWMVPSYKVVNIDVRMMFYTSSPRYVGVGVEMEDASMATSVYRGVPEGTWLYLFFFANESLICFRRRWWSWLDLSPKASFLWQTRF